ncbi:uncharacterized protein TNCT_35861 [Trichonephila clavata]|uniref:Uncharacterized protein n=1 Tax=Trichonephila clavata TaxID=2740835 RepID=A0A8X6HMW3_TRICU|nr:uncharacterized protein TNCT_489781 [Trichonephila clavata]GFR26543.1 uncharacterized protein TNCT_35801 [Trichonephila clavata]GFR26548.1 uncharacterized protein TNCT_35831 [Trichonephila clavata]GFR26554.1 uncharacterized protein TNCT_35861 [Trichonephila clavata]
MDSQLCLNVFTREMEQHDNPHLTFETLVLRLLKRVSHSFHLPWSHVLEVSRQAPYLMDPHLHQDLLHIWTLRSKQATLDEQHCVERILGRDNVRSSDLIKLASILQKISDPKTVYEFFAMDGYQGEDPKKYIDLFRYEAEEARGKHVRAVRQLYRSGLVQTPHECRSFLESIFEGTRPESRDGYVESVQEQVAEIAEWRREQQTKKKRPLETKEECVKKSAPGNP